VRLAKFNAICDLKKVTEEQFLLREFGIEISYEATDQEYSGNQKIIVSDNPKKWVTLLNTAPPHSLTFFLIGNETYVPDKYEFLNQFQSLKCALLYNPPKKAPYINIFKSLLGNILDGGFVPTSLPGSVFRDFRNSQFTRKKLNRINIKYSYIELPQGYCNSFVNQISTLSPELKMLVATKYSLFSKEFQSALEIFIKKTQTFSYLGQEIHHRRATCLRIAKTKFLVEVPSKIGFGGLVFDGDTTYLKNLLSTKFPLVPPGAFNNYNHRYTESLITGGLPAILAQNSLDPSVNDNWTNYLGFLRGHSFRLLMKYLSKISQIKFEEYYKSSYEAEFKRTRKAYEYFLSQQGNLFSNSK
jgi:hypothetical protein